MAGFFDSLNQGLTQLSQSPAGMAGMGLLMMPSQSFEPINPMEYAMQGMQMGVQNRQRAQLLEQQQAENARREAQYLMEIQEYQDRVLKAKQEETQQQRMLDAIGQFSMGLDPVQRLAFDALPLSEKSKVIVAQQFPATQEGRLPAASIQEFNLAKEQGYKGSFNDFLASKRTQPAPNMQFIPTAEGIMVGNTRTGGLTMGQPGVLPAAVDPRLAGQQAEAKAGGQVRGTSAAQSAISFPEAQAKAQYTLNLVDELVSHPGLSGAVGAPGAGKVAAKIPGTKEAGFMSLLNQIQGRQFLEAFESLKGGGQITQIEGDKATQAISRMNTAQSEAEFKAAANEFKGIVSNAIRRSQAKAGGNATMTPSGMPVTTDMQGGRVMDFNELPE
jgi:hypothetical protein